jgi:hypothetical protein
MFEKEVKREGGVGMIAPLYGVSNYPASGTEPSRRQRQHQAATQDPKTSKLQNFTFHIILFSLPN